MPSKDALLVVANRVWPLYARTNSPFGRDAPSSASHFFRVSSDNVVRLPLTTRVLMPRNCGGALTPSGDFPPPGPDAYVTTPPDCAPRIMVTSIIFSRISSASFLPAHAALMRITPKLPHSSVTDDDDDDDATAPREDGTPRPSRSVETASSAVTTAAMVAADDIDHPGSTAALERGPRFWDESRYRHDANATAMATTALATHPACRTGSISKAIGSSETSAATTTTCLPSIALATTFAVPVIVSTPSSRPIHHAAARCEASCTAPNSAWNASAHARDTSGMCARFHRPVAAMAIVRAPVRERVATIDVCSATVRGTKRPRMAKRARRR